MSKYYCVEDNEVEIEVELKDPFNDITIEEVAEKAAGMYRDIFAGEAFYDPSKSEIIKVYNDKKEFLGECSVSIEYYPTYSARKLARS